MASFSEPGFPVHVFFIAIFRVVYMLTTVVLVCRLPCLALWIIPSTSHLAAHCISVCMVDPGLLNVCVVIRVCNIHSSFGERSGCSQQCLLYTRFH